MILVTGDTGSGKSAVAEALFDGIKTEKYYLATMERSDELSEKRIEKHRRMREGKGFTTIEFTCDITRSLPLIGEGSALLLECATNLLSNLMFSGDERPGAQEAADKALEQILALREKTGLYVVVTNETGSWQGDYSGETREFIRAQEILNEALKKTAEKVITT
ncbi:MAG: bifunctional adenosylcobinamide kinase/adenosylcobinamide-phosphate guanylyltransferase [Lachnospiraceae bacterium]|nr:bifunctional adenosylcobinamide kinase/adenosylcobinamide-phosphate guanylyltransferase [Lachnospiraceae bacterium]